MGEALEAFITALQAPKQAAPALLLGLALLAGMPVLVLAGVAARTVRRVAAVPPAKRTRSACPGWPRKAWLEVVRKGQSSCVEIGDGLVRIGREGDNEVCLNDETVHRYHAAIHRTRDAEVMVTDLSAHAGNGVLVNGRRVGTARLKDGDTIGIGRAEVIFHSAPVAAREIEMVVGH